MMVKRDVEFICRNCHETGNLVRYTPGASNAELYLYIVSILCLVGFTIIYSFIGFVVGLLFLAFVLFCSVWRIGMRYWGCSYCGSEDVIPTSTPIGQKMLKDRLAIENGYCIISKGEAENDSIETVGDY